MGYFLGIFPDQKTNYKIRKVVGEVGRIFDGFDIDVRWTKPEDFHMELQYLGDINSIQRFVHQFNLKDFKSPKFEITLSSVNLGISRSHKELVYLSPSEGGDTLRETVFELREKLGIVDHRNFIPHMTLGRVNKDLTPQEQSNISKVLHKTMKGVDISFGTNRVFLVKKTSQGFVPIKEFN